MEKERPPKHGRREEDEYPSGKSNARGMNAKSEKAAAEKDKVTQKIVEEVYALQLKGIGDAAVTDTLLARGLSVDEIVRTFAAVKDVEQKYAKQGAVDLTPVSPPSAAEPTIPVSPAEPESEPIPSANPAIPADGQGVGSVSNDPRETEASEGKDEIDKEAVRKHALRILKYRTMGVSDEDIANNLKELGLRPEFIDESMQLMNTIDKGRTIRQKEKIREEKRSRSAERREQRALGASLGQVETRKGAAYQQQDEEMPLGRERIPSVPVDEGPMTQVETRKPGDEPAVSDAEPESDVDTSGVVNPFMLKPDAQADLDALIADVHASVEPPTVPVAYSTDPTAEEQRQLAVDRELDTFRREGWVQSMPTVEGTPKEWRERLRSLISSVKEKITPGERSEKMKAYLASRAEALGETAKEYGPRVEEFIRAKGEEYNRLSLTKKILVGGVLGVGAAAFSGVSTPLATAFAINLGIQRVAGMSSMFLKIEKYLQDHKGSNIGLGPLRIRDEKIKGAAAFGAVAYTALMGAAIGESVHLASESAYGQAVHEWLGRMLGHEPSSLAPAPQELPVAASVVQASSEVVVPQPAEAASSAPEGIAEKALDAPAAQPAAAAAAGETSSVGTPEVASIEVKATPGKGYEYMTKRLWEQLQEKNIKLPSGANPNSDLAKLLAADKDSIDTVVHQLAQENQFFKETGASVRISLDSHMSIDANGNILLNDPTLASEARNLAPENAPVTPAYHPEAPAYPATEGSGPVQDVLPDMPEEGPAGIAGTTATETTVEQFPSSDILIENQSPAPVIVRDFVVNKFDVAVPLAEPHIYAGPSGTNQVFAFGGEKMIRLNAMFEYLKAHPNAVVIAEDDSGNYRATWTLVKDRLVQGERLPKSGFFGRLSGAFLPPPGPDELSKLIK